MGLINALNIANTGLRTVQSGLNTVANNVAQADVRGYKRQDLAPETLGLTSGVRANIVRASNRFVENQVRIETGRAAQTAVNDTYLSRVDALFGVPGESGSFDSLLNTFNSSLEQLATSPDDYVTRQQVVGAADGLAKGLNRLSDEVQNLRQQAEDEIATTVSDINDSLQRLQNINSRVAGASSNDPARPELLNERDRQLARLADAMEIRVTTHDNGTISISSKSGNSLLEGTAAQLDFDQHGNIDAGSLYNTDDSKRGVGTVTLVTANGYNLDLINHGLLDTGRLGALINMRDNVLVETQTQLDELAAGLSRALSDREVVGQPVTAGAANGYSVDLGGLQQGNTVSLSYTENGTAKKITFVRVDDPSLLPLPDSHTATAGDRVIGVDFSAGFAAAAGAVNAILAPAINAIATADGLAFVDDGAANTTTIDSVTSTQTVTGLQSGSPALPMFVDGQGVQSAFSGAMEGVDSKIGFAGRISVNRALEENNELLVRYGSSPETLIGDPTRPLALLDRLNKTDAEFSPRTGLGSSASPYRGAVTDFARLVISDQTGKAASAAEANASQKIVVGSLEQRLSSETGVEIDEELSKLIGLQNSYAANARIMQAVDEMMQQLMRI